ncbi:unnamed protein product [Phytophthora fragariaefolia]|uniref:Unnamed protein product n=1 Tax=Phytophthora fragariaefolia TaxID=1490495 RepID=A0A9W6X8K5_9STRA|nr:unnamed protein product [Phytophthora fragariaefolia]
MIQRARFKLWQRVASSPTTISPSRCLLSDEIEVSDVALADNPEEDLRQRFVAAMAMCEDESITVVDNSATDPAEFECSANEIDLEDYAHELAFLPDLTDSASTVLDYGGSNGVCSAHTPSQREKLVKALKAHEGIMIASGNALPQPAYGAICDIDVQGHKPIKQRARRVPLKHLKKLYELLKGLLKAGLIALSNSPWASHIVIVLKKNGVDIRLCIDYKMVNAITVLMEYAMPLVDGLLTELESYLWFFSLDAASGFWAVMMTQRAREISAFGCAMGHFEWLRMPFGFKNAPMIYQRTIDNELWGYVQPRGGWASYAEKVRRAEAASATQRGRLSDPNQPTPDSVNSATKFEADHRALAESDPLQDLVNSPESDMFANGEPDESTLTPVFDRRSFVDDICFGVTTFEDCLATLSRLLARFTECRISMSITKSLTDLIIVGDSRLAIQQSMGVMACKKEALQLELARHKKLTDQLSSVRYLHVLRHYNAAADALATEALEINMGEPRTEMTVMTRRQTRRLHFEDEANKDSAGISKNTGLHYKEASSPNSRAEGLHFESPRAPKRVRRVENQAEVEVSNHVQTCEDCSTSKSKPQLRGYLPGNVTSEYPFQMVSMDSVRPLPADWDNIAKKMVHAINNSRDTTRRETPFYLVHGWDAQSTLKSMTSTIKQDPANSADAAQWRREANRQREIVLQLAKAYQLAEKAQRAEAHNARLSGKEKRYLPESTQLTRERSTDNEDADSDDEPAEPQRSLFRAGDPVWLFMERVRPGLKKKLAHRFRVKKKVEVFAYELELPDKSGCRFYPVVHVSWLKKVADLGQRPTVKLVGHKLTDTEDQRVTSGEASIDPKMSSPSRLAGVGALGEQVGGTDSAKSASSSTKRWKWLRSDSAELKTENPGWGQCRPPSRTNLYW